MLNDQIGKVLTTQPFVFLVFNHLISFYVIKFIVSIAFQLIAQITGYYECA